MSLRTPILALLACTALAVPLFAVAEAGADDAVITSAPALSGVPQVQQTLNATAGYTAPLGALIAWSWERCTGAGFATCAPITASSGGNQPNAPTRRLTSDDRGTQLRARITITVAGLAITAVSGKTPTIVGRNQPAPPPIAPPAATPTPVATATPTTAAAGEGGPTFEAAAPPAPAPPASSPTAGVAKPALLTPFPVVRLRGRLTSTGAVITELAVTAPRTASITVLCSGDSCPRKVARLKGARKPVRLRTFERSLRSGTRISIRVARKGYIGKRTLIRIQKGKAPKRADLCLSATGRTIRCTAA